MSARREKVENANETQQNRNVNANASETDFMLKIMTATPASPAQRASAATLTTVNAQNKCASAAPTTFSYQRAPKRGARLKETTRESEAEEESKEEQEEDEAATTTKACERQRQLAEHKAQLRAAFFKDFNEHQQQQQQQAQQQQQQSENANQTKADTRTQQLIAKFQTMIVQQSQQQLKPITTTTTTTLNSAANSDEGCNAGGLSPCSSDNECDAQSPNAIGIGIGSTNKPKVTRSASSDSALGLEVDEVEVSPPTAPQQRRMTLTVTDLPLRPALLPLAEPTALPDSPLNSPTTQIAIATGIITTTTTAGGVPSKVLLEERVVAAQSRRESTQSCLSELGGVGGGVVSGVRYVRTPSVVVSDYSDDITACGISMEEMEYFRLQRSRGQRRCSLEASAAAAGAGSGVGAKDEAQSDVSAASSCSNLYYCGSTISALDGGECIVNGVRVALARKSSHSSSGGDYEEEDEEEVEVEEDDVDCDELAAALAEVEVVERERERERVRQLEVEREKERQLSELLAATQLGDGLKKVCLQNKKTTHATNTKDLSKKLAINKKN
ncbi:uncharacterized protein LOC133848183 [Drosophila sulfurigaster albostrigata]|uniref:uncharacterized protein LOC133848183 n=1 Tax=Drosophila sulfurigaster albostrigata TaxID=89887 RepID=UPI002D21A86A|nr:uncharacterized protein LOC133848183 [Drosophila sulfurigaster albostrigata]